MTKDIDLKNTQMHTYFAIQFTPTANMNKTLKWYQQVLMLQVQGADYLISGNSFFKSYFEKIAQETWY